MSTREAADLLIEARWVLPIAPPCAALRDHAVAVRDGRIVALGPAPQLRARFAAAPRIERGSHVLLPGLIDAQTRSARRLLRGRLAPAGSDAEAARLRALQRWGGADFARDCARIAMAEMLRAGITAFAERSFWPEELARLASALRMRVHVGLPVAEHATPWAADLDAHLARAEALWDEHRTDPWVTLSFAPVGAVGEQALARVRRVADELDARVTLPVRSGGPDAARTGVHALGQLEALRLIGPGLTGLVAGPLAPEDLELVSRHCASLVLCPHDSLSRGDFAALAPAVFRHATAQHRLALGTGEPARTGTHELLPEVRLATLLAAAAQREAPELPAGQQATAALTWATLGGAAALGLSAETGSIEAGKAADLLCCSLAELECEPLPSPAAALALAGTRAQVCDVWIAGRALVAAGRLLAMDETELRAVAASWNTRLERDWDTRLEEMP